jgi:tRNA U34 5-carboxymethylaminomethyl modifying enzyme MnmG/GidA
MDILYQKLNKKLDGLSKQHQTTHYNDSNTNITPRLINLANITFTREHTHTLTMGPNYALEKDPKGYANELIMDTENAIRQLEPKIQNTFRYMASKKIKQVLTTSTYPPMHKRHQHNIKQIKNTLQRSI